MISKPLDPNNFRLPVKHFVQLDNTDPSQAPRECFLTSAAMLAEYCLNGELSRRAKLAGYAEPEDAYAVILQKYGDTTDWWAEEQALESLGISCYKSVTASIADVLNSLRKGLPVVVGTKYKGSGHIVIIVGYRNGKFIVLCPNGIRAGATNEWIKRFRSEADAEDDTYSPELMKEIFTDLGPEAGWALFTVAIKGKPTGVPTGL